MKPVIIERSCLVPLLLSAQEEYYKEVYGFLIGRDTHRKIDGEIVPVAAIEATYHLMTSERKPSQADIVKDRAFYRIINSLKAMGIDLRSGSGQSRTKILGAYHSHPDPDGNTVINSTDTDFDVEVLGKIRRGGQYEPADFWLDMIMHVSRRDYRKNHEPNNSKRDYPRKIGNILRFGYDGYEITTAGYWLRVHDLDTDSVRVEEAVLYAPWHLMKK